MQQSVDVVEDILTVNWFRRDRDPEIFDSVVRDGVAALVSVVSLFGKQVGFVCDLFVYNGRSTDSIRP